MAWKWRLDGLSDAVGDLARRLLRREERVSAMRRWTRIHCQGANAMLATHPSRLPVRSRALRLALGASLAMGPLGAAGAGAPAASAPLQATLLAEVTVTADVHDPEAIRLQVADTPPLRVTLMPTLHVIATAAAPAPASFALAGESMPPPACCIADFATAPAAAALPPC
jgi:hypothetical protein